MRRLLRWTQFILFAAAISLLGYCGFVLLDARAYQGHLEQTLRAPQTASPPALASGLIGRLEIPRLAVSVMVVEGINHSILRRAAGHIPGTSLPGQPGNVGISAHRDTFFRPLRNIRENDVITLTTLLGEFHYRVVSTRIVDPREVAVLKPGAGETLTLVTCYPFYFVGPAPDRFIVHAERIEGSS
jgi:sortase A